MGSGRDKRKKHTGKKPGSGATKTEQKTEKNSEKKMRRLQRAAQGGEDDIDALLAAFALEDARQSRVIVQEDSEPPSPRVYASFTPIPSQREDEIILFGGEFYDGDKDKTSVYADLYILNVARQTWKKVISPNGPSPRSSHQAVCTTTALWVWGGEFLSPSGDRFRHFNELWRFSLHDYKWELLKIKGAPSPRSGHRMVLDAKNKRFLVFGGFNDSGKEIVWYNDLVEFKLEELTWRLLSPTRPGQLAPPARGGCQISLMQNCLYVFGGISSKAERDSGALLSGKDDDEIHNVVYDDIWMYTFDSMSWSRIKKQGMAPSPRSAFGLVTYRDSAIIFGGIVDRPGKGDRLYSELFNDAYRWDVKSQRFYPLTFRSKKKIKQVEAGGDSAEDASSSTTLPAGVTPEMHALLQKMLAEKGSALHNAATKIQSHYRGMRVRRAYEAYRLGGQVSELLYSPAMYGIDFSARDMLKPRARAAPMMVVLRNTLWMLGGQVEIAHTDIVLDDIWSLNLSKLDGWQCVKQNTVGEDAFQELSDGWETGSESLGDDDVP